jgi:predicted MPP superfamily phosphohydrolase
MDFTAITDYAGNHPFLFTFTILTGIAFVLAVYAVLIEPNRLILRKRTVWFPNLPEKLNGLTIIHLSDLHHRHGQRRARRVLKVVNGLEPDLICFSGDVVEHPKHGPRSVHLFEKLSSKLGTFISPGNHDHGLIYDYDISKNMEGYRKAGAVVLINENSKMTYNDTDFYMIGVDDPQTAYDNIHQAMEGVPDEAFSIMLAHSPCMYEYAREHRVDFVLSGHTHGGQVRIPFLGAPYLNLRCKLRLDKGIFHIGNLTVHVSPGLSWVSWPIRFGVPAEITHITLQKGQ